MYIFKHKNMYDLYILKYMCVFICIYIHTCMFIHICVCLYIYERSKLKTTYGMIPKTWQILLSFLNLMDKNSVLVAFICLTMCDISFHISISFSLNCQHVSFDCTYLLPIFKS